MLATRSVGWRVKTPWTMSDGDRVVDGAVGHEDAAERRRCCRSPRSVALPPHGAGEARCSRCRRGGTRPGSTPRPGGPTPGRASLSPSERDGAVGAGHRRRPDVHDAGAALDAASRPRRSAASGSASESIGTAIRRSSVVEAPVVLEPPVEGREAGHRGRDVVAQRLLDAAAERREQQRGVEALLVERPSTRASRSRYSARIGSTCISVRGSTPSGIWPAEQRVEAARAR